MRRRLDAGEVVRFGVAEVVDRALLAVESPLPFSQGKVRGIVVLVIVRWA